MQNIFNRNKHEIEQLRSKIAELEGDMDKATKYLEPEKTILTWESPSRVFIEKTQRWFIQIAGVFVLFILLAAIFQRLDIILLLAVCLLLVYVLYTVPPEIVTHSITNKGINSIGNTYYWNDLKSYYFTKKENTIILNIDTRLNMPARLTMLLPEEGVTMDTLHELLYRKIEKLEINPQKQGWISRMTDGEYIT